MIPAGELIIEYGTYGNEFFMILEGKCGIYYKTRFDDPEIYKLKEDIKNLRFKTIIPEGRRVKSEFEGVQKISKVYHTDVEYRKGYGYVLYYFGALMKKVDIMTGDGSFGEVAMNEDNPNGMRMASILAEEDTHCAVLNRKSYFVIF